MLKDEGDTFPFASDKFLNAIDNKKDLKPKLEASYNWWV